MLVLLKLGADGAREPSSLGLLPKPPARWRAFLAGLAIDTLTLLVVLWMPVPPHPRDAQRYTVTQIAWADESAHLLLFPEVKKSTAVIPAGAVGPHPPPATVPGAPTAPPNLGVHLDMPLPALPPPNPLVISQNPGGGSRETPTDRASPYDVQTGGEDRKGAVAWRGDPPAQFAIPAGHDLPRGPGVGNGFAGRQGLPGILPSAGAGGGIGNGFGRGVGDGRGTNSPSSGGGFSAREFDPLVILEKPRPAYTDEAKRRRVEGEVVLEVVFGAGGEVRVVGVVQSLGYGLDEAAIEAARRIHFSPARHNGIPYEVTAKLRVVFQLAF